MCPLCIGRLVEKLSHRLGRLRRQVLENRVKDVEMRFEGVEDIPVPDFWGGLRVVPDMVEFWQGRESRLHDRFKYVRVGGNVNDWTIERLSP